MLDKIKHCETNWPKSALNIWKLTEKDTTILLLFCFGRGQNYHLDIVFNKTAMWDGDAATVFAKIPMPPV